MTTSPVTPSFSALLNDAQTSALKLELRDQYLLNDPAYLAWQRGDRDETLRRYAPWTRQVRTAVERGVDMRRVRIISEPVSAYIGFEYAVTDRVNVAAGERIRWLPRNRATELLLPAVDMWIFDGRAALSYYFSGDSEPAGATLIVDEIVVARHVAAIEAAWERGIDHAEYQPK